MHRMRSFTLSTAVLLGSDAVAFLQPASSQQENITMTAHQQDISQFVPQTHVEFSQRRVKIDGETATLTRYERRDKRNAGLEGEHFSTVVAADGTLKGFAKISLDLAGKILSSPERSEQVARDFLQQVEPDLLPRMKISWIKPHDELIHVQRAGRNETVTLTGMKVKARNLADGRWFWIIVGNNEKPMVFERDIVWITFPGHRKTEKWLHDGWLVGQEIN